MKIISWNVNSIRSRIDKLEYVIKTHVPDVVFLQELKCEDHNFPHENIENLGYNYAILGQKTYNGVAILSKHPIEDIQKNMPDFDDPQARYIEGIINGIYMISVYVPNGGSLDSDNYHYKLRFMDHLYQRLDMLLKRDTPIIIGGDFNIAHTPADIYEPKEQICFSYTERQKLNTLYNLGFIDTLRLTTPESGGQPGPFSWWDYRGRQYHNNQGMRIDYIFLSPDLMKKHNKTEIDKSVRDLEQTSDHAPVVTTLKYS